MSEENFTFAEPVADEPREAVEETAGEDAVTADADAEQLEAEATVDAANDGPVNITEDSRGVEL